MVALPAIRLTAAAAAVSPTQSPVERPLAQWLRLPFPFGPWRLLTHLKWALPHAVCSFPQAPHPLLDRPRLRSTRYTPRSGFSPPPILELQTRPGTGTIGLRVSPHPYFWVRGERACLEVSEPSAPTRQRLCGLFFG